MERRIEEINRFTVGWTVYFAFADTASPFRELDKWLRRRLRQVRWKEWKRVRTKLRMLRGSRIPERDARRWAFSRTGYWAHRGLSGPLHCPAQRILDPARPKLRLAWKGSSSPTAVSGMLSGRPVPTHTRWVVWGASG
jgi:Group II intron, maturase-specific domain